MVFFDDSELKGLGEVRARLSRARYSVAWLRDQARPTYVFGAGVTLDYVFEHSVLGALRLDGVLDNNPARAGGSAHGLPIYLAKERWGQLRRENAIVILVMTSRDFLVQVREQCLAEGIKAVDWYEVDRLSVPGVEPALVEEDSEAARALDIWSTFDSKRLYRSLVRFRVTRSLVDLPPSLDNQYFSEAVPRHYYRSFVDVGAYAGDTLHGFQLRFGDAFDNYYAFEPISTFADGLRKAAGADPKVEVFQMAVADSIGTVTMQMLGMSSAVRENGGIEVKQSTLDRELDGRKATFIKMDIEGLETRALAGAMRTIQHRRPVLAISVYHELEHLWKIPLWIHDLGLRYRLLLEHYDRSHFETICYAIPE